jgi:hypothetical protein
MQNWNDEAAQGKPALCHGTYDEPLAGDAQAHGPALHQWGKRRRQAIRDVGFARKVQDGSESPIAGKKGKAVPLLAVAREFRRFRVDQPAIAPDAPVVAEDSIARLLAHSVASQ